MVIRRSLTPYQEQTVPIADAYRDRGVLATVDGTGRVEQITYRIHTAITQVFPGRPQRTPASVGPRSVGSPRVAG
jgi:hypothetical protein